MSRRYFVWSAIVVVGFLTLLPGSLSAQEGDVKLDGDEAKKAFDYLNDVRVDPKAYSREIGVELTGVKAMPALKWNKTLAKVAETKALDMAQRDYFGHVTPEGLGINIMMHESGYKLPAYMIKDKKANFFESLCAGQDTGTKAIRFLILDDGVADFGHRKHLLGMSDLWAKNKDAGIGIARNPKSKYKTYVCVILAHQR